MAGSWNLPSWMEKALLAGSPLLTLFRTVWERPAREGGRDALKGMLAWGLPPTNFWGPFGTLNSKVCTNQNGLLKGLASLPGPTHEKPEPVSVGQHFKCSFYSEQKHFPGKSILIIQPRLGGHPAHPE